jgi:nicotinate-nucleotide adenylyltransferase
MKRPPPELSARLGLFGGSFDPIHTGHLILAERAIEELKLDRILFIPARVSPLKTATPPVSAKDRLDMVKAAIKGNPRFEMTDVEIRRGEKSFTIDTVEGLQKKSKDAMFLLVGTDSVMALDRWHRIADLARRVTFAILARPGSQDIAVPEAARTYTVVPAPLLELSSTEIRTRVRQGRSIRYMVPERVSDIIRRKDLYRT